MKAEEALRKPAVTIEADAALADAANLMDSKVVGALIVCAGERAVGIVTDRDLVVRGLARGLLPTARVDSVMSTDLVTLNADDDLRRAYRLFHDHGIRRIPILDAGGRPVGMVTTDDLLIDLAGDLADLARPVTGQTLFGAPEPHVPATR